MMSWLPPNVSTYGTTIDQLFYFIYYLTGGKAVYTHGNTTLEIIWTAIPAVLLAGLALAGRTTWLDIKARQPATDYIIRVTAKQFNGEIRYPGPDTKFDTDDDVVMDNDFHVPVNKPVRVQLRSRDVIHSFF